VYCSKVERLPARRFRTVERINEMHSFKEAIVHGMTGRPSADACRQIRTIAARIAGSE
jgi:hypothetical protein